MEEGRMAALEQAARAAAVHSYAPYSRFSVGAAVLTAEGEVFTGCNIENASLGLSICAERTAIFRAVAGGYRRLSAVVVYTPTARAVAPCGACRQVLAEFGRRVVVVSVCDSGHRLETTLEGLLPEPFGSESLHTSGGGSDVR